MTVLVVDTGLEPGAATQGVSGGGADGVSSRCRIYQVLAIIRTLTQSWDARQSRLTPGKALPPGASMATCPECDADIEVDEFDVDKGDLISCPDCGSNLEVSSLAPLELESADDDDDEDDDEDDDDVDLDEDAEDADLDEEEDETTGEDWDE